MKLYAFVCLVLLGLGFFVVYRQEVNNEAKCREACAGQRFWTKPVPGRIPDCYCLSDDGKWELQRID